ncbi:MAG: hypothetical protein V5A68_02150 [Candidatus Thermoplasmatota archaeon]
MKKEIVAVIWNDASEYEGEEFNDETFELSPTFQIGLLHGEDKDKVRIVHSYTLDHEEHDFVVIPKSLIIKRKTLGTFDTKTKEIC